MNNQRRNISINYIRPTKLSKNNNLDDENNYSQPESVANNGSNNDKRK